MSSGDCPGLAKKRGAMGVRLHKEPELENPVLIASWPGIGNVGLMAVDAMRGLLEAEEFGEIEPWEFFYPKRVLIRSGEMKELEFPSSRFFFKRTEKRDLIFFIGEEQPADGGRPYAQGTSAYLIANLVLDVACKFGCGRVYTSGAAVSPIHHSVRPRVWAVPNSERLLPEMSAYGNTVLMSDIEGRGGEGNITGLNGLLLGVARKRGMDAVCVMGEVPIYLQGFPLPYPKATKSVLEVLSAALGISVDLTGIDSLAQRTEQEIERLYQEFPPQIKEQLDKLKYVTYARPAETGPITEEDKQKILENIDKLFKKKPEEG